jgi:hypothetical protein
MNIQGASNILRLETAGADIAAHAQSGLERATRGGQEWIEGSVQACEAFYRARKRFTSNSTYNAWIMQHEFDRSVPEPHDRAAMVHLGADPVQARKVFETTLFRSYRKIWEYAKPTWTGAKPKPVQQHNAVMESESITAKRHSRKARPKTANDAEVHRKLKLGEHYDAIKGTSLDTPKEKDALVTLLEGQSDFSIAMTGENPLVPALVKRAVEGQLVSAIQICSDKKRMPPPTAEQLIKSWSQSKLLSLWLRASDEVQDKLLDYLMEHRRG